MVGLIGAYISINRGWVGDITRFLGYLTWNTAATTSDFLVQQRELQQQEKILEEERKAKLKIQMAEKLEAERLQAERKAEETKKLIEMQLMEKQKIVEERRLQAEKLEADRLAMEIKLQEQKLKEQQILGKITMHSAMFLETLLMRLSSCSKPSGLKS